MKKIQGVNDVSYGEAVPGNGRYGSSNMDLEIRVSRLNMVLWILII
jgi:hypothetical protein